MTKCLVTGGAGFIGSHLATALVKRGDSVRVLDNLVTGSRSNLAQINDQIEFLEGDVTDRVAVERAVEGAEIIYHQAALASVPWSVRRPLDTNAACVTGTLNLLDAAREAKVRRLVYAGSSSVYGNEPTMPKRETDLPAPLSPYAAAKLAGEAYCHAFTETFGFETVVIRYFNVPGPRQDPTSEYSAVIPLFVTAMLSGRRPTVFGDGSQSRDFTFVDDVVQGNMLAAQAAGAAGKVFNVACGKPYSLLQLIEAINRVIGTTIEPTFDKPRVGDVRESLADISAARAVLDYEPTVDFEEGLHRSIEYYRTLT